jgi:signal transduction histidine kinase
VRELNLAAEAIAAHEYDRRVHINREDELGALAHAFNHMATEIQKSLREAEHANRTKSEFLANMSHEIRTPINAILGYTNLMEMGLAGPLVEQQQAHLRRVSMSSRHLLALIDDLLDFTRIESAVVTVDERVATAEEAVRLAVAVIEPAAGAKQIEVIVLCDPHLQYVGDPRRVEQILVNLMSNAVKFTPPGGTVRIECRAAGIAGQLMAAEFVVEDTGIGIPADQLENIFRPFVQVRAGYTRPHGGTGLGLTISTKLAELMGGIITVSSQEGVGSRFTLTLRSPALSPAPQVPAVIEIPVIE